MLKTEAYRQYCLKELRAGNFKAKSVLPLFCEKFDLGERTFYKYWRQAKKEYEDYISETKAMTREAAVDAEVALENLNLVNKAERMEIASLIARSETHKPQDRLKALDYLSKIDGDYAPEKKEITKEVNNNINLDRYSSEVLEKALLNESQSHTD